MGLNRQDKAAVIEEVKALAAESTSLIFADYRGLSVEAITALRKEARQNGVKLRVEPCRRRDSVCLRCR